MIRDFKKRCARGVPNPGWDRVHFQYKQVQVHRTKLSGQRLRLGWPTTRTVFHSDSGARTSGSIPVCSLHIDIEVTRILHGSPAELGGLRIGQRILCDSARAGCPRGGRPPEAPRLWGTRVSGEAASIGRGVSAPISLRILSGSQPVPRPRPALRLETYSTVEGHRNIGADARKIAWETKAGSHRSPWKLTMTARPVAKAGIDHIGNWRPIRPDRSRGPSPRLGGGTQSDSLNEWTPYGTCLDSGRASQGKDVNSAISGTVMDGMGELGTDSPRR
eukprot:gene10613-biopygen5121